MEKGRAPFKILIIKSQSYRDRSSKTDFPIDFLSKFSDIEYRVHEL
jgi:hypothetical protein